MASVGYTHVMTSSQKWTDSQCATVPTWSDIIHHVIGEVTESVYITQCTQAGSFLSLSNHTEKHTSTLRIVINFIKYKPCIGIHHSSVCCTHTNIQFTSTIWRYQLSNSCNEAYMCIHACVE